jgi:hypothetical protein
MTSALDGGGWSTSLPGIGQLYNVHIFETHYTYFQRKKKLQSIKKFNLVKTVAFSGFTLDEIL